MAGKRQATCDLNHDNWDEPEEPEERGTFRTASADELKGRVIKKARRKITDDSEAPKSVFGGFAGFAKSTPVAASPFSFLSKIPATNTPTATFAFGGASAKEKAACAAEAKKKKNDVENGGKSSNYYAKLKALNQSVSDWIKTHVDKNPICILSPIFKDYEKHLGEIENEENGEKPLSTISSETKALGFQTSTTSGKTEVPSASPLTGFKFSASPSTTTTSTGISTTSTASKFSFGVASSTSSPFSTPLSNAETAPTQKPTNIFGNASKPTAEPQKTNGFSFETAKSDGKSTTGFNFNSAKSADATAEEKKPVLSGFSFLAGAAPLSFGNIQPPSASATSTGTKAGEDDEEDQPPKVEFKQVVEEDAIYSKKCKVFVKKDNTFADRGVGTLYLKPVKDSEKTQLLVRADTNLGNILVNLILNSALPVQRMGKNNVMMVCLPTPDVEKPTSMLLRVKTGEEADELLETIEKHKK